MQQAIAMLDSGVGGLTVVKEVMRQLPREKIIYFGDNARSPYGPQSAAQVKLFTQQIIAYLMQFEPKMIVIACNTATAIALDDIRAFVSIPVIGVIYPSARAALATTESGYIGVIGTEGTIYSGAYERVLKSLSPYVKVVSQACPHLSPLVEKGLFRSYDSICHTVYESLAPLQKYPLDTLILGCTHYPFLADSIQMIVGKDVNLINCAEETAREISAILQENKILEQKEVFPTHRFFCSGNPAIFKKIARTWLDTHIHAVPVVWQIPNIIG